MQIAVYAWFKGLAERYIGIGARLGGPAHPLVVELGNVKNPGDSIVGGHRPVSACIPLIAARSAGGDEPGVLHIGDAIEGRRRTAPDCRASLSSGGTDWRSQIDAAGQQLSLAWSAEVGRSAAAGRQDFQDPGYAAAGANYRRSDRVGPVASDERAELRGFDELRREGFVDLREASPRRRGKKKSLSLTIGPAELEASQVRAWFPTRTGSSAERAAVAVVGVQPGLARREKTRCRENRWCHSWVTVLICAPVLRLVFGVMGRRGDGGSGPTALAGWGSRQPRRRYSRDC